MARKTKAEALLTRSQILDAAERIFHKHGSVKATLHAVAVEAGLSRGAIYWHFKNKEEMLVAAVERALLDWREDLATQSLGHASDLENNLVITALRPLEKGHFLWVEFLGFCGESCLIDQHVLPPHLMLLLDSCIHGYLDGMMVHLERALALGKLPAGISTEIAAMGLFSLVMGLRRWAPQVPCIVRDPSAMRFAIATYIHGLTVTGCSYFMDPKSGLNVSTDPAYRLKLVPKLHTGSGAQ